MDMKSRPNVRVTDVQRNVRYCLLHFQQTNANRQRLAEALQVNLSTITRWVGLKTKPHGKHVGKIAGLCQIPVELFQGEHRLFVEAVSKLDAARTIFMDYEKIDRRIVLGCIEKWKHHIDECFQHHAGSYFMYSRLLSEPTGAAISLLRITDKSDLGITFDIYNVDNRVPPDSKPIVYRYVGLMFPVAECLAFYGEEQSGNEPLAMITSSAQVPGRSILGGYFAAVAVHGATRTPTGTKLALSFKSNKLLDPDEQLSKLGIVSLAQLPKQIREMI